VSPHASDSNLRLKRTFSLRGSRRGTSHSSEDSIDEVDNTSHVEAAKQQAQVASGSFNPKYAGELKPSTRSMFPNYHSPEEEEANRQNTLEPQRRLGWGPVR